MEAMNTEVERANNLLRKELEWMRRQPQARGTKAKYRIDAFYELEKKAKQQRDNGNVNLDVKASYIGSKIFEAEHVTKSFGNIKIVEDFNYIFARFEKMGIVGNNGTGKSTFIKMLMGEVEPDSGRFDVGETVRFGYYSQDGLKFDEQMKVIDVVQDIAEYVDLGDGKKLGVSQFLNYFLFCFFGQNSVIYYKALFIVAEAVYFFVVLFSYCGLLRVFVPLKRRKIGIAHLILYFGFHGHKVVNRYMIYLCKLFKSY